MRSSEDILQLVLEVADADERIRAVLLNGSRADPHAKKDRFQDFDLVYLVRQMETFLADHSWIDIFGERIILQMPEAMAIGSKDENCFHYLMLFTDRNRIDLTLFPLEKLTALTKDSLTVVLMDKDQLFSDPVLPSNKDYLIRPPSVKEFSDCCNEFWWVATYVAKGLARNEFIYALGMYEVHLRPMFLKMIEWHIGIETGFAVALGIYGKHIKDHISPALYSQILSTYPGPQKNSVWQSFFMMTEIFSSLAATIAAGMQISYNREEEINIINYLKQVFEDQNN